MTTNDVDCLVRSVFSSESNTEEGDESTSEIWLSYSSGKATRRWREREREVRAEDKENEAPFVSF